MTTQMSFVESSRVPTVVAEVEDPLPLRVPYQLFFAFFCASLLVCVCVCVCVSALEVVFVLMTHR